MGPLVVPVEAGGQVHWERLALAVAAVATVVVIGAAAEVVMVAGSSSEAGTAPMGLDAVQSGSVGAVHMLDVGTASDDLAAAAAADIGVQPVESVLETVVIRAGHLRMSLSRKTVLVVDW